MLSDRRRWLVGGAVALALGAAAWAFFGPSASTPSARSPQGTSRRAASSEAPLPAAESVRLAALEAPRDEPSSASRNPFRFGRRAPAVAEPGTEPTPVSTLTPPSPAAPAGPPPPPPIPLKFIGVVEKADGTTLAVLVPSQGDAPSPLHGREGDIIDGRYRIVKIGIESIELMYLDGRGRQTIRLTGQ
ncbi:MAG TPA: hypothetical protein PLH72_10785 [Vicinamibacterales bacterium]|nr:hypothetical protein [Vicinamibacterales bacterium]